MGCRFNEGGTETSLYIYGESLNIGLSSCYFYGAIQKSGTAILLDGQNGPIGIQGVRITNVYVFAYEIGMSFQNGIDSLGIVNCLVDQCGTGLSIGGAALVGATNCFFGINGFYTPTQVALISGLESGSFTNCTFAGTSGEEYGVNFTGTSSNASFKDCQITSCGTNFNNTASVGRFYQINCGNATNVGPDNFPVTVNFGSGLNSYGPVTFTYGATISGLNTMAGYYMSNNSLTGSVTFNTEGDYNWQNPEGTYVFVLRANNQVLTGNQSIDDGFGNAAFKGVVHAGSGNANYVYLAGAATGQDPTVAAMGSDENININLVPKGTGFVYLGGNANAPAFCGGGFSNNDDVTWTAGTSVPTATQIAGSLYSRTNGPVGGRLYVSAGGGVWNAVPGV